MEPSWEQNEMELELLAMPMVFEVPCYKLKRHAGYIPPDFLQPECLNGCFSPRGIDVGSSFLGLLKFAVVLCYSIGYYRV